MPNQPEEVVDLFFGAHGGLVHVVFEVGGAHQHPPVERVNQHDAAVAVLEEDLASAGRSQQFRVIEHDVRALGAAHEMGVSPERLVGEVGPRA